MEGINFISKLEKNLNNPTIFKLQKFPEEGRKLFLQDYLLGQKAKNKGIEKFVRSVIKLGIVRIENFPCSGKVETINIEKIDDRLIDQFSICLVVELWGEIMQLNFVGSHG